jgi:uncharacterized protein YceH (UPF0502 family)
MHNFADISSVEAFLEEMAERASGALVRKLARAAGSRESRWAHLLGGEPAGDETSGVVVDAGAEDLSLGEVAALKAHVARLEAELASVKALLARVCSELGIDGAS